MNNFELLQIRHAYSLINDLQPTEDGFIECIEEAAGTLAYLIEENTKSDTEAQILKLVTNA